LKPIAAPSLAGERTGKAPAGHLRLTVATYNVHRCIGRDGLQDAERVARVLREMDASIVGLQEVESFQQGEPQHHQLTRIVRATGLIAVAGPAMYRPEAHYGNSLLTRERLLRVQRHDISVSNREPRGAVEADLDVEGCRIRAIAAHLGLGTRERRCQARQLLEIVARQPHVPTIVLADFNEWLFCGPPLFWFRSSFGRSRPRRTFPSHFPLLALDRIWASPPARVLRTHAHRSPLACVASDHLPLTAVVELARADAACEAEER
jgi:endonuclease/exonuclease/phosphatase family metal-dependent hydrolase